MSVPLLCRLRSGIGGSMFGSQFGTELSGTPTEGLVARLCGHPAEACEFLNREAHLRDITGPAAVDARVAVL